MAYPYPNAIPDHYETPPFPSLYWPFRARSGESKYLDSLTDIWRFTLYWTLITIPAAHFLVAVWAILMHLTSTLHRNRHQPRKTLSAKNRRLLGVDDNPLAAAAKTAGVILGVYLVVGGIEALLAGSLVGLVLGAVYSAGYFRMSTWTPFLWSIINMLVLILASFRIQGGL